MTRADDHLLEPRQGEHILQGQTPHQQIAGDMEQSLGAGVDVSDGEIRSQDHPALGGGIDPGQQLRRVDRCGREA